MLAHRDALDAQIRDVRKEMRAIQRHNRVCSTIPRGMWKIVTTIFALTHPATEPACLYLEQKWQHWDPERLDVEQRLRSWHTNLLAHSNISTVLQPTNEVQLKVLKQARRFLQELQLHEWVEHANIQQGIAPRTSVLVHRASMQPTSPHTLSLLHVTMNTKSKLQWLRRWRNRWRVGLGPVGARDTLSPAVCRKKVAFTSLIQSLLIGVTPGTNRG